MSERESLPPLRYDREDFLRMFVLNCAIYGDHRMGTEAETADLTKLGFHPDEIHPDFSDQTAELMLFYSADWAWSQLYEEYRASTRDIAAPADRIRAFFERITDCYPPDSLEAVERSFHRNWAAYISATQEPEFVEASSWFRQLRDAINEDGQRMRESYDAVSALEFWADEVMNATYDHRENLFDRDSVIEAALEAA